MNRDIKAIILMLSTQAMINLGVIPDPVTQGKQFYPDKAEVFIDLLQVLEEKTAGNLSREELLYLQEVLKNLNDVYNANVSKTDR